MRHQLHRLTISLVLVGVIVAATACSSANIGSTNPEDASRTTLNPSPSSSVTLDAEPAITSPMAGPEVPEPQFGETTRPQPGTVTLSAAAKAFVPPTTMPLYRIVPASITETDSRALAERLGMGEAQVHIRDRLPSLQLWINDGEWLLAFFRGDLNCFRLTAKEGDREATEAFERGEDVHAVSAEEAIAVADEYLAARGFREGLGQPEAFVRTSVGRSGGGQPDVTGLVITRGVSYPAQIGGLRLLDASVTVDVAPGGRVIAFSRTMQQAEPDEMEVPILSVEEAAEDVRAGQGIFPNEARADNVSEVTIVRVELAYYNPPEGLAETHYRPVYVFRVRMADGAEGDWIVSAYEGIRR